MTSIELKALMYDEYAALESIQAQSQAVQAETSQRLQALQAQAQWDAGLTKKNVSADEADAAVERFQTLLEL